MGWKRREENNQSIVHRGAPGFVKGSEAANFSWIERSLRDYKVDRHGDWTSERMFQHSVG
jgi:hypothetical protein